MRHHHRHVLTQQREQRAQNLAGEPKLARHAKTLTRPHKRVAAQHDDNPLTVRRLLASFHSLPAALVSFYREG
jgi:hypothetical protein